MGKMRKDGTLKGMLIAGGDGCVGYSCGGRRISCSFSQLLSVEGMRKNMDLLRQTLPQSPFCLCFSIPSFSISARVYILYLLSYLNFYLFLIKYIYSQEFLL